MRPSSVDDPVATTMATPLPREMVLPEYTMLLLSPRTLRSATAEPWSFFTGTDSPVRDASSVSRLAEPINRPSAETLSPVERTITSPATSSRDGTSTSRPPRRTVTLGEASSCSASSVFSALYSCVYPNMVFRATMNRMTPALIISSVDESMMPTPADTAAAMMRMKTRGSLSCLRRIWRRDTFLFPISSLGPSLARRMEASSAVRPSPEERSASATFDASMACHSRPMS